MDATSQRNRLITADVIANAWNDPDFKKHLLANPTQILREAGVEGIADDHTIVAHENTPANKYIVLPSNTSPAHYLPALEKLLTKASPLHPNAELTLVQNSPDVTHLVIPQAPSHVAGNADASHAQLAAAAGYEAVTVNAVTLVNVNINGPSVNVISGPAVVNVVSTVIDGGVIVTGVTTVTAVAATVAMA